MRGSNRFLAIGGVVALAIVALGLGSVLARSAWGGAIPLLSRLIDGPAATGGLAGGDEAADVGSDDPSSQDLITAAVTAGELDPDTALLYRVYAQFHDPRLPREYQGADAGHELWLDAEARDRWGELPPEIRDSLEPYLLRPTDPRSAFTSAETSDASASAPLLATSHLEATTPVVDRDDGRGCTNGWATVALEVDDLRVWICRSGDWEADLGSLRGVEEALGRHWGRMTAAPPAGMGPPIPDDPDEQGHPDADERIDIYVLDQGWLTPERGDTETGLDGHPGVARFAAPFGDDHSASGYVLLDRQLLTDPVELETTLVHELFHVLQGAHTYMLPPRAAWFKEGTARWAETYYVRDHSARIHDEHHPPAQVSPFSLLADAPDDRPYEAYLWPLFLEQEVGPEAIFTVWEQLGGATTHEELLDALDTHLPVSETFPEFAMRVLNTAPEGDPVPTRFAHLDPGFTDDRPPALASIDRSHELGDEPLEIDYSGWHTHSVTGDDQGTVPVPRGLPGLSYRYDMIELAGARGGGDGEVPTIRVEADDTLRSHAEDAVLEALVRDGADGSYRRQRIDLERGASFCDAAVVLLVLTNTSTDHDRLVTGTVTAERGEVEDCCAFDIIWDGTFEYVLEEDASVDPSRPPLSGGDPPNVEVIESEQRRTTSADQRSGSDIPLGPWTLDEGQYVLVFNALDGLGDPPASGPGYYWSLDLSGAVPPGETGTFTIPYREESPGSGLRFEVYGDNGSAGVRGPVEVELTANDVAPGPPPFEDVLTVRALRGTFRAHITNEDTALTIEGSFSYSRDACRPVDGG